MSSGGTLGLSILDPDPSTLHRISIRPLVNSKSGGYLSMTLQCLLMGKKSTVVQYNQYKHMYVHLSK